MQAFQLSIMQMLLKIMSPTSPAYGNTMAFEKPQTPKDIENKLKPGDVIFSRTNSYIYQITRKYMGIKYDHVAVVINDKEVIHISPPIISKIDLSYIVDPRRQPLIIRPKVQDMEKFLLILHNYLGEKYNLRAIGQIALRQLQAKLKQQEKNEFSLAGLKHSRICSDSVLYALIRSNSQIQRYLERQITKTKFEEIGFFLPDQIADILLANGSEIVLKSKFQYQYKFMETLSLGGEKILNVVQKSIQLAKVGRSKLNDAVATWRKEKNENKQQKAPVTKLQVITLMLTLAHLMGIVTISSKVRFMMLMMHTMMMVGHFQEFKHKFWRKQSSL